MRKLVIHEDQTTYAGNFSSPAFALWGAGARIIEGLYRAFTDYGVGLNDISLDTSPDSTSLGVKVDLGKLGDYKFSFEQVEWTMSGINDEDLSRIPEVLRNGD